MPCKLYKLFNGLISQSNNFQRIEARRQRAIEESVADGDVALTASRYNGVVARKWASHNSNFLIDVEQLFFCRARVARYRVLELFDLGIGNRGGATRVADFGQPPDDAGNVTGCEQLPGLAVEKGVTGDQRTEAGGSGARRPGRDVGARKAPGNGELLVDGYSRGVPLGCTARLQCSRASDAGRFNCHSFNYTARNIAMST
jgi:hypothetical protein